MLRLTPLGNSPDARALLARGLFESRREKDAIAAAEEILGEDPGHYQTRFLLGQIYSARGETWRAMLELGRVLRAHPRHRDTLRLVGDLHFQVGAFDNAAACFRRVLDQNHHDASVWLRLAAIDFARGRDEDATSAFRRALRFDPTLGSGGHSIGDYYSLLRTVRPRAQRG